MFVRSGTGIQGIRTNGQGVAVSNAGYYFTGEIATNAYDYSTKYADGMIAIDAKKKNENQFFHSPTSFPPTALESIPHS